MGVDKNKDTREIIKLRYLQLQQNNKYSLATGQINIKCYTQTFYLSSLSCISYQKQQQQKSQGNKKYNLKKLNKHQIQSQI
jgi:hypothetical protein